MSEPDNHLEAVNAINVNWLLHPPSGVSKERVKMFLGHALPADLRDQEQGTVFFSAPSGWNIVADPVRENAIDLAEGQGAGAISSKDGHEPLLFLLQLQREWARNHEQPLITLCDDDGTEMLFNEYSDLLDVLEHLDFDIDKRVDEVRHDAVDMGLVLPKINLATCETDVENFFF